MKEYIFKLTDKVRDYECDLQGVVNNSNYQHYMEHTRHEFLESLGENFGKMHEKGVDGFVSRVEIQYKTSLKSGDSYISCLNVYKKGVKLVFEQDIYRASDNALATKGIVESVIVENGKLTRGEYFDEMLKRYMTDKRIYQIGLTMINGVGDILARHLLQALGEAEAVFTEKQQLLGRIPGIGSNIAAEIKRPEILQRAEKELAFIEKNNISCYYLTDTDYPVRLRECPDAPILFYFKGNTNLDATRIISIVGTRNATEYGRELTESLIKDLAKVIPDLLVVSGLAYGIDICAHRNALYNRLPTVAVLAHGLDRIYPSCHRNTAVEMLESGGLLTDFPSGTEPDRPNFLRRNRIVAGISDCTIVVESAEKGGSLVTADIAFSYGRDVYSFPGRIGDSHSKGCNNLIRQNKAGLITSADDLLSALCWDIQAGATPVQTELFFAEAETFTSEQNPVLAIMRTRNEIHINELGLQQLTHVQYFFIKLFIAVNIICFQRDLLVREKHEVINQNLCSFFQGFFRMNGTVGSNLKYQFLVVGLLLYTEVLYLILHITYRSINRIDRNYVHIGAIFAVFVSRNITTTFVDRNIYLHSRL